MRRLLPLLSLVALFACGSPNAPTPPPQPTPPVQTPVPVPPVVVDTTVTVSLHVVAVNDPSQKLAGARVGMAPWDDGGAATPPGQQLTNADGFATWRVEPGHHYLGVVQGVVLIDREMIAGPIHWICYYSPNGGPTTRCERT